MDFAGEELPEADESREERKHPRRALTTVGINALTAAGAYADGYGLRLVIDYDKGPKRWELWISVRGKRCQLGLGSYPEVSLAAARERTLELRRIRREGGDVLQAHRKGRKGSLVPTFEKVARKVHAELTPSLKNKRHIASWLSSLEMYVFPLIGSRPVDALTQTEILTVFRQKAAETDLKPFWLSREETAGRVLQRARRVFEYAKAHGWRSEACPCEAIERILPPQLGKTKRTKHYPALPYARLPEFMFALRNHSEAGVSNRLCTEFTILNASRVSEVRFATWGEFDLERAVWTIPGTRMKAGLPHEVPLSERSLEILAEIKSSTGAEKAEDLVFPNPRGKAFSENAANNLVFVIAEKIEAGNIVMHGFRSTFRDWAAECSSAKRDVIEASLAHVVQNAVERAYLRSKFLEQRRSLMAAWATFSCKSSETTGSTVVQLGNARLTN